MLSFEEFIGNHLPLYFVSKLNEESAAFVNELKLISSVESLIKMINEISSSFGQSYYLYKQTGFSLNKCFSYVSEKARNFSQIENKKKIKLLEFHLLFYVLALINKAITYSNTESTQIEKFSATIQKNIEKTLNLLTIFHVHDMQILVSSLQQIVLSVFSTFYTPALQSQLLTSLLKYDWEKENIDQIKKYAVQIKPVQKKMHDQPVLLNLSTEPQNKDSLLSTSSLFREFFDRASVKEEAISNHTPITIQKNISIQSEPVYENPSQPLLDKPIKMLSSNQKNYDFDRRRNLPHRSLYTSYGSKVVIVQKSQSKKPVSAGSTAQKLSSGKSFVTSASKISEALEKDEESKKIINPFHYEEGKSKSSCSSTPGLQKTHYWNQDILAINTPIPIEKTINHNRFNITKKAITFD